MLALAVVALVACNTRDTHLEGPLEAMMEEDVRTITESTQIHWYELSIAAGNLMRDEYVDVNGNTRYGVTAALWIVVDDVPEVQSYSVHLGQEVIEGGYIIRVLDIGVRDGTGYVQVGLRPETVD